MRAPAKRTATVWLAWLCLASAGLVGCNTGGAGPDVAGGPHSWAPRPTTAAGLQVLATANAQGYSLHTLGGDRRFLPGVNLGSTTPGHLPGELSISAEDYRHWFAGMGELGIRAVRIYTIHPPAFYSELAAYNMAHPDRPLYLVQGVYLPDESYVEKGNLYDAAVTEAFTAELRDASAAISGHLSRGRTPGRASGTWTTDVSAWLAGWIIGVEWDPEATRSTDEKNASAPRHAGRYFLSTPAASPTERWLAARMDELATAEAAQGRSSPMAFANWPTADPLQHPREPLPQEDLVGVDANHVRATPAWPAGEFASYHAYPYYPDFQRYEYTSAPDPYAAYLAALRKHHAGMPVMITEFGVPSSIGTAHTGPLGRGQGDHSEREAMEIDAALLRVIHEQGMSGGFVFAWTDEWFKFTWNTITHQVPGDRRQLWHDPLTNEQYFGIVATDPLGPPDAQPAILLEDQAGRPAHRITSRIDESFLHLRITLADPAPDKLTVGLDVLPELSGGPPPGSTDKRPDTAFVLDLRERTGQSWIRAALDPLTLDYPVPTEDRGPAVGGWLQYELVTNRAYVVPETGTHHALELFNVGRLRYGTLDPAARDADSRALWYRDGSDVDIRIPWAMAGFSDPSSHRVLRPDKGAGETAVSPGVTVVLSAGGVDQATSPVTWEQWQQVRYVERRKPGADTLRTAFEDTAG